MNLLAIDSSDIVTSNSFTAGCEMVETVNLRGDKKWNFVTLKHINFNNHVNS